MMPQQMSRLLLLVLLPLLLIFNFSTALGQDEGLLAPPALPGEVIYIPFPVAITLDGDLSDWAGIPVSTVTQGSMLSADAAENGQFTVAVAADLENFYITMTMRDQTIITNQHGAEYWNEDSLEFYLNLSDELNTNAYSDGIYQLRVTPADIGNDEATALTITGVNSSAMTVSGFVFATEDGWGFEAAVPLNDFITPAHGLEIGFQAQANGATEQDRNVKLIWSTVDTSDGSWQNPSLFGSGLFFEVGQTEIPQASERIVVEAAPTVTAPPHAINVNQIGYYPDAPKRAAFHWESEEPVTWVLWDEQGILQEFDSTIVIGFDDTSGDYVHQIDFSEFREAGMGYVLETDELSSVPFEISNSIYSKLKEDALAYFYLNRSGIALEAAYAGEAWARPAGHLSDNDVTCFQGLDANGKAWPGCEYTLDVSGGWYDAGDYGKYVVNGGISLWTMMNQYELSPTSFADGSLKIPEENNGVPDILDEARWEMRFLLAMQIPDGYEQAGMVHHKMHDREWEGIPFLPPSEVDNDNEHQDEGSGRYLYPASTAATLNLAATAAQCARIWSTIDTDFATTCLNAAERAWQAAQNNPRLYAGNVPGAGGGNYEDDNVSDEFYWAAAELFITTGKETYRTFLSSSPHFRRIPSDIAGMYWGNTAALGTISLALLPNDLPAEDSATARANIVAAADLYLNVLEDEPYLMPITQFEWGSNSSILNNMLLMGLAYQFTDDANYINGMTESMDYLMGRNPLNKSYVSGYGEHAMQHPHHRVWANDPANGYPPPPPGVVAGGPNEEPNDPTAIEAGLVEVAPAKRYTDEIGSWTTNEVTINWNAPLAWVTAFMDEHKNGRQPLLAVTEQEEIQQEPAADATATSVPDVTPLPTAILAAQVEATTASETPSEGLDRNLMLILLLSIGLAMGTVIWLRVRHRSEE